MIHSFQVLSALRDIIHLEKLYDEKNFTIIICDRDLEAALYMKALHITEVK